MNTESMLLERERELASLEQALTEAHRGHGQVVLVEAQAGLGKTTLLRAASDAAVEGGYTCLRARAGELESDFAYGCVRQLLEPVILRASNAERERLFAATATLAEPLFAPTGAVPSASSADTALSMLHGLYWLLGNLADRAPVLLLVDDLQWADTESLRFLNYLAPRLDGLALAVVASARAGEKARADLARLAAGPETDPAAAGPVERRCGRDPVPTTTRPRCDAASSRRRAGRLRVATPSSWRRSSTKRANRRSRRTHAKRRPSDESAPPRWLKQCCCGFRKLRAATSALVRAAAVLGNCESLDEARILPASPRRKHPKRPICSPPSRS